MEPHTLTCPIPQCGALGLRDEFDVDLTASSGISSNMQISKISSNSNRRKDFRYSSAVLRAGTSAPCSVHRFWRRKHVQAAAAAYRRRLEMEKHLVHEHPSRGLSWNADFMQAFAADSRVQWPSVQLEAQSPDLRCEDWPHSTGDKLDDVVSRTAPGFEERCVAAVQPQGTSSNCIQRSHRSSHRSWWPWLAPCLQ